MTMMGVGSIGMLAMGLAMFLFWGFLIFVAVLFVRMLFSSGSFLKETPSNQESVLQILNQRYARGEIDRQQYELMKEDLI